MMVWKCQETHCFCILEQPVSTLFLNSGVKKKKAMLCIFSLPLNCQGQLHPPCPPSPRSLSWSLSPCQLIPGAAFYTVPSCSQHGPWFHFLFIIFFLISPTLENKGLNPEKQRSRDGVPRALHDFWGGGVEGLYETQNWPTFPLLEVWVVHMSNSCNLLEV